VLGGVATNFGVEQTAREAVGSGYSVVLASDAMASVSAQHHEFAIQNILPMIGRVRTVAELTGN
jgi:nicotinamidase-related amidase